MKMKHITQGLIAASIAATSLMAATAAVAAESQFVGALVYRSGPYAPAGVPYADEIGRAHV